MKKPKILILDIESSMLIKGGFSLAPTKTRTPIEHIIQDWVIISVAWKWKGSKKIEAIHVPKRDLHNDKRVVTKLKKLIDQADILIGHNIDAFDWKKLNTRCIFYKLGPLNKIATVDTLKVARREFKFTSDKLDYLATFLGVGSKLDNTRGLWIRIAKGDATAINEMVKYNKQDVKIQEKVYERMLPYITNHPNMNVITGSDELVCTNCGSDKVHRNGYRMTRAGRYVRYRCDSCGAHFRSKSILKSYDGR